MTSDSKNLASVCLLNPMGLDQYAYAVSKRSVGKEDFDFDLSERVKRARLADWRNHWNLADWMAFHYYKKGGKKGPKKRCSISLRLHERDLDVLEQDVREGKLYGYVFRVPVDGKPKGSPDHEFDGICLACDQEFLKKARQAIGDGKAVVYQDWW